MHKQCEHKNIKRQAYWGRCVDCGAARFGNGGWITSSVELAYLDHLAVKLEKIITQHDDQDGIPKK